MKAGPNITKTQAVHTHTKAQTHLHTQIQAHTGRQTHACGCARAASSAAESKQNETKQNTEKQTICVVLSLTYE